jgi:hypothetical protein
MKTIVFTCEKNKSLLSGFSYLWDKYCKLPFLISGIGDELPPMHGDYENLNTGNYPLNKWSNQVIDTLNMVEDDLVLFMLDDYWLIRQADLESLSVGCQMLVRDEEVYAFDASTNTLFSKDKIFVREINYRKMYVSNNQYAYSFQAYVWKRRRLLASLRREENPWVAEMSGLSRIGMSPKRIFTFENPCLYYANVKYKGEWDFEGKTVTPQRTLTKEDWNLIRELGYAS